ncbi:helix-turn-helix domain-containing protein [Micromonospora tarensis]|uniref:Helix-turn-helix domain-containing protein n=1 Tax=Micromonospora tarensis TaxID=2806100 RepID=A0ABS1YIH9_9ACTN|nr:helix-turn-helix domain-containing protein [Micromonospora tarensis]MBM0277224.1 helix-turn-helix domain-containing protein [Micromonospora tarensis]
MDEAGQREHLAKAIETRRIELGLSGAAAARAAGIDRATWTSAENGTRRTAEHNYAGIERALQWKPGSIRAVLGGGEPMTLDPSASEPVDEEIELVRTDPRLTADMRERIIRLIVERRERDRAAALDDTRRLIDLFKQS